MRCNNYGRLVCFSILLLVFASPVLAPNDPGHDTLYVEQQGDSELTGNLNISDELQVADLFYSTYLDILGNGSAPGNSKAEIYATSGSELYINAPGNLRLSAGGGSMVYVGDAASVDLNVSQNIYVTGVVNATGNIYSNNTLMQKRVSGVCGADEAINTINEDGTVSCQSTSGASSGGGWTNTSTATGTSLNVEITNSSGYQVFWVNTTSRQAEFNGSTICTPANGLCNQSGTSEATVEAFIYDNDNTLAGNWTVAASGAYDINFDSSTFYLDSNGNRVGIGTNQPNSSLDVVGNIEIANGYFYGARRSDTNFIKALGVIGDVIIIGNASDSIASEVQILTPFDTDQGVNIYNGSDSVAFFRNDLYVGINNSAPGSTLDVTGNISAVGAIYAVGSQVCTAGNGLCATSGDGAGGWTNVSTVTTTTLIVNISNNLNVTGYIHQGVGTDDNAAHNTFHDPIAIDTTAPELRLRNGTVDGYLRLVGNDMQFVGESNNVSLFLENFGRVGVNNSDPNASLDVVGDVNIGAVGTGTALSVGYGSQAFTVDPSVTNSIVMNSTGGTNVTITSDGGSVIIKLG